jgi:predicted Zn-dependent peptidase
LITSLREQPGERPFRVETLPNGLRVCVVPQPHLSRAHVSMYVRVGSRYETAETNGLSHFLEHMIYRGSPRLKTAHDVNFAFESLGGYLYAATQVDFGVFSVTLPPETLAEATSHFAEVLSKPTFADIELEKGIVCEEILEDLDDDGRMIDADNISRQMIYPSHPLGFTITGDEKQVKSFSEPMLRAHHARHYNTANAVLGFSGNIDYETGFALATQHFADSMPRGTEVTAEAPTHSQKKPRFKVVENTSSQTELRVCFRAVGERTEWRPAVDMLMRVLDDGMSTRLYHSICDDKGLCYDVGAGFDGYEDDGVLDFAAGVQHMRTSVVTREIVDMLVRLAKEGPTEEELAKARRRNAWETRQLWDSPDELGGFYTGSILFERFETPEARLAGNSRVTAKRIQELCQLILTPERLNVLAVGLLENDEDKRLADVVRQFKGVS